MLPQILRSARRTVLFQIRRARAHYAADLSDLARDQPAVRQRADAHCQVDMILDQIQRAVGQQQADVDALVLPQEFSHYRRDVQATEHDRRGNCQFALRRVVLARCASLGIGYRFEDALAVLDVRLAGFGQHELARRAHE
jgi:hypothetical protein